jgi:hypothetical protein
MRGFRGHLVAVEEKVTIKALKIFAWEVYVDAKGLVSQII